MATYQEVQETNYRLGLENENLKKVLKLMEQDLKVAQATAVKILDKNEILDRKELRYRIQISKLQKQVEKLTDDLRQIDTLESMRREVVADHVKEKNEMRDEIRDLKRQLQSGPSARYHGYNSGIPTASSGWGHR
jgi:chromosome segregation ATPase